MMIFHLVVFTVVLVIAIISGQQAWNESTKESSPTVVSAFVSGACIIIALFQFFFITNMVVR